MQTQQILSANILDILFDGRNKNYGAYDLRKNYNKRVIYALSGTFIICLLFTIGSILANSKKAKPVMNITELTLDPYKKIEERVIEKPKELPQPKPQEPIKTIAVNIPVITPDDQVKPDEVIKPIEDIENVRIGAATVDGKDAPAHRCRAG